MHLDFFEGCDEDDVCKKLNRPHTKIDHHILFFWTSSAKLPIELQKRRSRSILSLYQIRIGTTRVHLLLKDTLWLQESLSEREDIECVVIGRREEHGTEIVECVSVLMLSVPNSNVGV